jgi:hypothetical protein
MTALTRKILRAVCAAVAFGFIALVGYFYAPVLQAGQTLQSQDAIPLAAAAFALLIPASYALTAGRRRDALMMVGSVGVTLLLGCFAVWVWVSLVADGYSLRSVLRDGFPRNLFFFLGLALLAANAIVCFRSLRLRVETATD